LEIAPFSRMLNPIPTTTTGQGSATSSLNFRHLLSRESLNQQPPTVKQKDISGIEKVTVADILKDLTTIAEKLPDEMNAPNSIIDDYSYNSFGVSDIHSFNSGYEEMTTTFFLLNNELKDVLAENPTINDLVDKLRTIPSVVNLFSVAKAVEGLNNAQQSQIQPILSGINTFLEQEFPSFKNKDIPSSENMLKSFAKMNTNDQAHLEGQVLFGKLLEQSNDRVLVVDKLLNLSNGLNARKHESFQTNIHIKKDIVSELRSISSSSNTLMLIENLIEKLDIQTIQSVLVNTANRFIQNNVNKDQLIVKDFEDHVHFMGAGKNTSILKVEPDLEQKHQQIIDQSIHLIETGLSQLSNLDIDSSAIKEVLSKGLNEAIGTEGFDGPNKIVVTAELHPLLNTLLMLHQDLEKTDFKLKEISQQIQLISQDNSNSLPINEIEFDVSTLDSYVKGIKSILDGIQLLSLRNKGTTSLFFNIEEAIKTEINNLKQLQEELGDTQPTISKLLMSDSLGEYKQPTVKFLSEIKEESFVLQLNSMSSTEIDANGTTIKSDASIRQEFTNQLLDAFKNSKFAQMPNGANRLILKLNPEHLGVVTVKLIQKNGEMIARLITSSGSAKELLDHSIHQLKQVLPNVQIEIERFDVQTEHSTKTIKDQSENREDRSNEEQQQSHDDEENNNEQSFMESLKAVLNTTV